MKENGSILFVMDGVSRELHRLMDENLKRKGLTGAQIHLLGYLSGKEKENKQVTQREICTSCLNIRASSATSLLQTLERSGYIVRERGEDERSKTVRLTEEGGRIAEECWQFVAQLQNAVDGQFSEEERARFVDYFKRIRAVLDAYKN